jgi:hypothetical protein
VLLAAGCGGSEDVTSYLPTGATGTVQFGLADVADYRADPLAIDSAVVREDWLHVFVAYSGGCATHSFAALSAGAFLESNPVQLRIVIAHDASGDSCEAWLHGELRFDLARVRQAYARAYRSRSGEVILQLLPAADSAVAPVRVRYSF